MWTLYDVYLEHVIVAMPRLECMSLQLHETELSL